MHSMTPVSLHDQYSAVFAITPNTSPVPKAKAGCWVWDLATDVLIADAAMQSLLGIRPTAPHRRLMAFSKSICMEDQQRVKKILQALCRDGQPLAGTFGVAYGGQAPRLLRWQGSRLRQPKYPTSTIGGTAMLATCAESHVHGLKLVVTPRRGCFLQ